MHRDKCYIQSCYGTSCYLPHFHCLRRRHAFFTNFGKLKNRPRMLPLCPWKSAQSCDILILTIKKGRFVVSLPRKSDAKQLRESRSQAVRRFMSLERSLTLNGRFNEFEAVMQEYLDMNHAERVPLKDMNKPEREIFYLPMHAVYKSSSTTTKVRAVFDASAKSSSGMSLNDTLLVGPTIHPPLIDVLLRFRQHRIALTADVSKMYRAV